MHIARVWFVDANGLEPYLKNYMAYVCILYSYANVDISKIFATAHWGPSSRRRQTLGNILNTTGYPENMLGPEDK